MPHDQHGDLLAVGDRVQVPAVVQSISTGEDYCNLTIQSRYGRKPDGAVETMTLNAAVVEKYTEKCTEGKDCDQEAPANPDFTVLQSGNQQGAWIKKGDATLAAVYKVPGQPDPYVCIYPQTAVTSTPYAMSIDETGKIMLQLPPNGNRTAPMVVPMDQVVALLEAAVPIKQL
jgi:hypothetical protein